MDVGAQDTRARTIEVARFYLVYEERKRRKGIKCCSW